MHVLVGYVWCVMVCELLWAARIQAQLLAAWSSGMILAQGAMDRSWVQFPAPP